MAIVEWSKMTNVQWSKMTNLRQLYTQLVTQLIKESSDNTDLSASETIPYVEIIDYLNSKCSKHYKHSSRIAREKIRARWNEGFRLEDFKTVIDVKSDDWVNDTKMNKYLSPDTLFGSKFEIYLNSTMPKQKTNNFVITKGMKM